MIDAPAPESYDELLLLTELLLETEDEELVLEELVFEELLLELTEELVELLLETLLLELELDAIEAVMIAETSVRSVRRAA